MLPVQRELYRRRRENREHVLLRRNMRNLRDASDPFGLPDVRFVELFRLNKDLVRYLFQNLRGAMEPSIRNSRIVYQQRILICLRFLATGSYQRSIGHDFNLSVSQPVVSRCIIEVTSAIEDVLAAQWIKFPVRVMEKNAIKEVFMERTGFPGVLGAIDCTHVAIVAPRDEEHNYVNRKGYHSKNVQLICDYNLKILNINSNFPGSSHDSFIWRNSLIKERLQGNYTRGERGSWLIGDAGYPLQPWLMVPIQGAEDNTPEGRYNIIHRRARNCVERCIGTLKTRFRCLLRERVLRYEPHRVGVIVNACAVLHNMCRTAGMEIPYQHLEDVGNIVPEPIVDVLQAGRDERAILIQRYFQIL